jgi:Na+-transporting NADH:ubiquinone oxidoreductase subunit B
MLRKQLDKLAPLFEKGGKFEKLYPLYEAADTFLFTPGEVTRAPSHVRDGIDQKRMMMTVVVALIPCILMAMYNVGYQAHHFIAQGAAPLDDWQTQLFSALGFANDDPSDHLANLVHGALYFLPMYVVVMAVGGSVEVAFCVARRHEVTEGFLVTGALVPLVLPPTLPLWQAALGVTFGVVFAKEVFGGVGMNFLNPALTARAFLFFAYPAFMSGDSPWVAANLHGVDGLSGATWLAQAAAGSSAVDYGNMDAWMNSFLGFEPGSMGETSALACLIGAVVLLVTGVGSWRTMVGVLSGTFFMSLTLNAIGSSTNPMFAMPFEWHVVLGGWAFGTVFMATDPVSSAFTEVGKYFYGLGIGVLVVLVRVVNPAYPEGMMLAILFMNMFAPLIDHFVVQANIKRRLARSAA